MTLAASIYSFKARTLAKNPAFTAIAFVDVDRNGDGVYDFTVYGNYNIAASTTVTSALNRAKNQMTDIQKGWVDSLLKQFGA